MSGKNSVMPPTLINLTHGLINYQTTLDGLSCYDVVFCDSLNEFTVLAEDRRVHRFDSEGRPLRPSRDAKKMFFTKLLWAKGMDNFLGWDPRDTNIDIFATDFRWLGKCTLSLPVENILYDPSSNELIMAARHSVKVYIKKSIQLELKDEFPFLIEAYPTMNIQICALAPLSTGLQRLYICGYTHGSVVDVRKQNVINFRANIHSSRISAALYHKTLQWLITGDENGQVRGWDNDWNLTLKMNHHKNYVSIIIENPTANGFISFGSDCQMVVWSAILQDVAQMHKFRSPVINAAVNTLDLTLAILTCNLSFWNMESLYRFHSALSAPASCLVTPTHYGLPWRTFVASSDSIVRVICPMSGTQITVQAFSKVKEVFLIDYCYYLDVLYSVINDHKTILVSHCNKNPTEVYRVWELPNNAPHITSLAVFENVHLLQRIPGTSLEDFGKRKADGEKVLVFVGLQDGRLASVHPVNGTEEWINQVHKSSIKNLVSIYDLKLLVSFEETVIKVWKVSLLYRIHPLTSVLSLYYSTPVTQLKTINDMLCFTTSSEECTQHPVLMYNFMQKVKWEHSESNDHKCLILDMCTSTSLNFCATSSMDGTIRLWTEKNFLFKIINLNSIPKLVTFSSVDCDITVCLGNHLYKIPHQGFLHSEYKSIDMNKGECPIPISKDDTGDDYAVLYPRLPEKFLDSSEFNVLDSHKIRTLKHYEIRDKDIIDIIKGKLLAQKKILIDKLRGSKSWRKNLKQILQSTSTKAPTDKAQQTGRQHYMNILKLRQRHAEKIKILTVKAMKKMGLYDIADGPPRALTGFIPNSVLYKILGIEGSSIVLDDEYNVKLSSTPIARSGHEEPARSRSETSDSDLSDVTLQQKQKVPDTSSSDGKGESEETEAKKPRDSYGELEYLGGITYDRHTGTSTYERDTTYDRETTYGTEPTYGSEPTYGRESTYGSEPTSGTEPTYGREHTYEGKKFEETGFKSKRRKGKALMGIAYDEGRKGIKERTKEEMIPKRLYDRLRQPKTIEDLLNVLKELGLIHKDIMDLQDSNILDLLALAYAGNIYALLALEGLGEISAHYKQIIRDKIIKDLFGALGDPKAMKQLLLIIEKLKLNDLDTIRALLVLLAVSNKTIRSMILKTLHSLGLYDPGHVLENYANIWEKELLDKCFIDGKYDFAKAMELIEKWIRHWMDTLEVHVLTVLEQLRDEELTTEIDSCVLDTLERIIEGSRKQLSILDKTVDVDMETNVTEMTVTLDPNLVHLKPGTILPLEGITYFCEVHNSELGRRVGKHERSCISDVQMIPEDNLSLSMKSHAPIESFIHMPIPAVQVGDIPPCPGPILLTLTTSQKYFWPEMSHVK